MPNRFHIERARVVLGLIPVPTRTCQDCGVGIDERGGAAKFCFGCVATRKRSRQKLYNARRAARELAVKAEKSRRVRWEPVAKYIPTQAALALQTEFTKGFTLSMAASRVGVTLAEARRLLRASYSDNSHPVPSDGENRTKVLLHENPGG